MASNFHFFTYVSKSFNIRNQNTYADCAVEGMSGGVHQFKHQTLVNNGCGDPRQKHMRDQCAEAKVEASIGTLQFGSCHYAEDVLAVRKSLICYVRCARRTDKTNPSIWAPQTETEDRDCSWRLLERFWESDGMEQLEKAIESSASVIRKIKLSKPVERGVCKKWLSGSTRSRVFHLGAGKAAAATGGSDWHCSPAGRHAIIGIFGAI